MKKTASLLASLTILSGCASVQPVPVCPEILPLTAREPLGPSFQQEMRLFLQGSLPEQTDSAQP